MDLNNTKFLHISCNVHCLLSKGVTLIVTEITENNINSIIYAYMNYFSYTELSLKMRQGLLYTDCPFDLPSKCHCMYTVYVYTCFSCLLSEQRNNTNM